MIQAVRRDRASTMASPSSRCVLLSMPDFLLGTLLLVLFVIMIPLLPADVPGRPDLDGVGDYMRAMTLPAVTLAIVMAVYAVRMLRDNLIEVLDSDYVRMAELKGLSRRARAAAPCPAQCAGADAQRHRPQSRLPRRRRGDRREGLRLSRLRQPAGGRAPAARRAADRGDRADRRGGLYRRPISWPMSARSCSTRG